MASDQPNQDHHKLPHGPLKREHDALAPNRPPQAHEARQPPGQHHPPRGPAILRPDGQVILNLILRGVESYRTNILGGSTSKVAIAGCLEEEKNSGALTNTATYCWGREGGWIIERLFGLSERFLIVPNGPLSKMQKLPLITQWFKGLLAKGDQQ